MSYWYALNARFSALRIVAMLACVTSILGCGSATIGWRGQPADEQFALTSGLVEMSSSSPTKNATKVSFNARSAQAKKADRLMVYQAEFSILVANAEQSAREFIAAVTAADGYLSKRNNQRVTCRVPAAKFFELTERVRNMGRVLVDRIEAEDVTREYQDLELRIKTAQEALTRLEAILETADKIEAVLEIEKEMRRLTEEIERMKGQLRFFADRVSHSTITVEFTANAPEQRPINLRTRSPFPWIDQLGIEAVLTRI